MGKKKKKKELLFLIQKISKLLQNWNWIKVCAILCNYPLIYMTNSQNYVVDQMFEFVFGMEVVTNKATCHHASRNLYPVQEAQGWHSLFGQQELRCKST